MVKGVNLPILNEIWKHHVFDSIQVEASGRSGGLVSIWRTDFFTLIKSWKYKYWLASILRLPLTRDTVQTGWDLHIPFPLPVYDAGKLLDLCVEIDSFRLIDDVLDRVICANSSNVYSVSDAVSIICSIPVRLILAQRRILPPNVSTVCVWCSIEDESIAHLLLHCKRTFRILKDLFRWWNIRWVIPSSIVDFSFDWFFGMGINASKFWKLIGPAAIWAIWIGRNEIVFNGKFTCRSAIVRNIKLKAFLWASS
ncbi:uncharacterized protein [Rutidosis leptorrhynchoides]|uniref:uncharacterized protein n=1 Tax=Rutidosis leptorrhynchoides TaxID=125765 RepID=UPI003A990E56